MWQQDSESMVGHHQVGMDRRLGMDVRYGFFLYSGEDID